MIQVTEDDPTKWKELYTYGPGAERISMTYLPAYDHDNGWEPYPGAGGAEPGVVPKTLYYITDILGSNLGLMEPDGRMSARYHYDEFGMVLDSKKFDVNWPGPDNLIGYTGLEYDYYTDLNYARARYYKPEIGRFISEDTYRGELWNTLSQNRFTYVHNNPLRYIDPSGHVAIAAPILAELIKDGVVILIGLWGIYNTPAIDVSTPPLVAPKVETETKGISKEQIDEYFNKNKGIEGIPLNRSGIDIEVFSNHVDEIANMIIYIANLNDPFETAKSGGKHSGFYDQYVDKTRTEIEKAIKSLDKQIAEHIDKIKNPEKYIKDFDQLDSRQQEALLTKKWPSDIQRQTEQKNILEGILKGK